MYKFFVLVCLLLINAASPIGALAATLSISPSTGVYSAGATFSTRVVVNTSGKPINAAEGTIKFNPSELSVVSIDRSSSIFNLWVTEPTYSNSAGTVSFSGGLPSGYTGAAGTVFSITFRSKGAGSPKVSLTGGSVLANDGLGTNVLTSMNGGTYTIQAESLTPKAEEVVVEYVAPANTPGVPQITSDTHKGGESWSANREAKLSWVLPSGVVAVRTLLDEAATTIPTKVYDSPISNITLADLDEGISYFHLQFKNEEGWGRVAHYRLAIDSTKPSEFTITKADGVEDANPAQTLALKAVDATSRVTRFMVRIDATEPYEFLDNDNTGKITLPVLDPGYHTLVIEAFDEAANSIIATYSFSIESFSQPIFTEYPSEINEEVIPVIKGETRPGSAVVVYVSQLGAEPVTYNLQADEAGVFTLIPSGKFQNGVYEITARATDTYGAQSELSTPIRIAVQQPGFLRVGNYLISVLSVIIPLIALVVTLAVFLWFVLLYSRRFRRKVSIESHEVLAVLNREFASLRTSVTAKKTVLSESRKTNKLTKLEEATFLDIEAAIFNAEGQIQKEVLDVEKLLEKSKK